MKPFRNRLHFSFRLTALFLSVLLVFSNSLVYSASSPTRPSNIFASQILIPETFGQIDESFSGTSGKTIVYIQDAHDSLEAQENIAKIIQHLVEHNGVKTVYEEGYEGVVPTDQYFSFVKDPVIKEKISYFLMDKLRLGGAEYAHVNRKKDFKLIGADSIKLHLENIRQYQESAKRKAETEKDLESIAKEVKRLADQHFPKELKEWMKLKERFDEGKLDLLSYLKRMAALKPSLTISAHIGLLLRADNGTDQEAVQAVKEIDSKIIFQEIDILENNIADHFLKSERDRMIFQHYKSVGLLKRLSDIRLSPDEYELVKTTLQELKTKNFARFIVEITDKSIVLSKRWEKNIQNAIQFYEIAEARDQLVAKSLDTFLDSPDEKLAVMVFGGFHKNRLQEILKRKRLSCVIVSPKTTAISEIHQRYYQELMSVGRLSFEPSSYVRTAAPAGRAVEVIADLPPYLEAMPDNVFSKELKEAVRSEMRSGSQALPQSLFRIVKGSAEEEALGYNYSYLKLGTPEQVDGFSTQLLDKIRKNLGQVLHQEKSDWVVVNVGGFAIPNAASLVSQRIAEQLNLPHVILETGLKSDPQKIGQYASLARKSERGLIVHGNLAIKETDVPLFQGKKVIFIDDAMMTGTILNQALELLLQSNAKHVEPYLFVQLDGLGDNTFENRINRKALERDGLRALIEVLNDEKAIYTTRLVYYSFELDPWRFRELLSQLTPVAKLNLYFYSLEYFASKSPANVNLLVKELENQIGIKFPTAEVLRGIRSEKFFQTVADFLKQHRYRIPFEAAQSGAQRINDLVIDEYRKQKPTRLVLYDLNGTLFFSEKYDEAVRLATRKFLSKHLGIAEEAVVERIKQLRNALKAQGLPLRQSEIAKEFGIPWTTLDEAIIKNVTAKDYIGVDAQLIEILAGQKAQGYQLAILSDGTLTQVQDVLKVLGIHDFFDAIITADKAGHFKPDADFYRYAVDLFGVKPDETVMVGDNLELDSLPALALGMKAIQIRSKADLSTLSKDISLLALRSREPLSDNEIQDKFEGGLLGTFVGDALGMPLEDRSYDELKAQPQVAQMLPGKEHELKETGAQFVLPKGHGTDDSILMIGLAESVIERKDISQDSIIEKFAANYDPSHGYSSSTRRFLDLMRRGVSRSEVLNQEQQSRMTNGAASRIAPAALFYYNDIETLEQKLLETITVTHRHPSAVVGALLQGFAIAYALKERPRFEFDTTDFVDKLIEQAKRLEEKYYQDSPDQTGRIYSKKLGIVKNFLLGRTEVSPEEVVEKLGNGFNAHDSIVTSLYAFLRNPYSFRNAVVYAVNLGGDADTLGAMTGAISGVFLGQSAIPSGWLEDLHPFGNGGIEKGRDYILTLADQILEVERSRPISENRSGRSELRNIPVNNLRSRYLINIDVNTFDALSNDQRSEFYKLFTARSEVRFVFNMDGERRLTPALIELMDFDKRHDNVEVRLNPSISGFQGRRIINVTKEGIQSNAARLLEKKLRGSKDFYPVRYGKSDTEAGRLTAALLLLDSGSDAWLQGHPDFEIPSFLRSEIRQILDNFLYVSRSA